MSHFGTNAGKHRSVIEADLNTPQEVVVFFFRSKTQLDGIPLPLTEGANHELDSTIKEWAGKVDADFSQKFGFDLYRPTIYNPDNKNTDKVVDIYGRTLPLRFPITLKEIGNVNTKKYYITENFKLTEETTKRVYGRYYKPNVLVPVNTEIIIYARAIIAKDPKSSDSVEVNFSFDGNAVGKITMSVTPESEIKKNKGVYKITLQTTNKPINDADNIKLVAEVTVNNKTYFGGACRFKDNTPYTFPVVLVDTGYTTQATALALDHDILTKKGTIQAGISIKTSVTRQILTLGDADSLPNHGDGAVNIGHILDEKLQEDGVTLDYASVKSENARDQLLGLCVYKFYEQYTNTLIDNIEKKYRATEFLTKRDGTKVMLLGASENLFDVFSYNIDGYNSDSFDREVTSYFRRFLQEDTYTPSPVFLFNNIRSGEGKAIGLGYIALKGAYITADAEQASVEKRTMTTIHEIGHNLGLRHTFILPAERGLGDILKSIQELIDKIDRVNADFEHRLRRFETSLNKLSDMVTQANQHICQYITPKHARIVEIATNGGVKAEDALNGVKPHLTDAGDQWKELKQKLVDAQGKINATDKVGINDAEDLIKEALVADNECGVSRNNIHNAIMYNTLYGVNDTFSKMKGVIESKKHYLPLKYFNVMSEVGDIATYIQSGKNTTCPAFNTPNYFKNLKEYMEGDGMGYSISQLGDNVFHFYSDINSIITMIGRRKTDDGSDLDLGVSHSLENIMDYPVAAGGSNSFTTYQWNIMRRIVGRFAGTPNLLLTNMATPNGDYYMDGNDNNNLGLFWEAMINRYLQRRRLQTNVLAEPERDAVQADMETIVKDEVRAIVSALRALSN